MILKLFNESKRPQLWVIFSFGSIRNKQGSKWCEQNDRSNDGICLREVAPPTIPYYEQSFDATTTDML
jgi:hypothetical protein